MGNTGCTQLYTDVHNDLKGIMSRDQSVSKRGDYGCRPAYCQVIRVVHSVRTQ
jgi:hypothetical protein